MLELKPHFDHTKFAGHRGGAELPTASRISISETIGLLEGQFSEVARGILENRYVLWLGSAISRNRVLGLDGVLEKLIENLRLRITADPGCVHRAALETIIGLAELDIDQLSKIDLDVTSSSWGTSLEVLKDRLWNKYSKVLSLDLPGQKLDYLLWDVLDFKNTFASQHADAEHLAIAMLVLEGVVSDVATANWDGLLEAAMTELGQPAQNYQVTVTGGDLKGPAALAVLYKFHGCALRAIEDEPNYRSLLIAREAQIVGWLRDKRFEMVREQIAALVARKRTLMIGLSAQDADIQAMFANRGWKWNEAPTPIVIANQSLSDGQKTVLEVAYGEDFEANREAIASETVLPAHSKALLLALLLTAISDKLEVLSAAIAAPLLDENARKQIASGVRILRGRAAVAGEADRHAFAQHMAMTFGRAHQQLMAGVSNDGPQPYIPLDSQPAHQMKSNMKLAFTGQREAAAAIGLIGLEVGDAFWDVSVDDPKLKRSGAIRINVPNATARVFFASNDSNINGLLDDGAFNDDEGDVVVICSKNVVEAQQRSPSANLRTLDPKPRFVGLGDLLRDAGSLDELRVQFKAEVGL